MTILTDCPDDIPEILAGAKPDSGLDPSPELQMLWDRLEPRIRPKAFCVDEDERLGGWEAVMVQRYARNSQFDALVNAARKNSCLPDSLACFALSGEHFHGQRSRPWKAVPGNIHFSSYLRWDAPVAPIQAALSMLPTIAVVDAVAECLPDLKGVGIKWINDVYLEGAKIAGVLTQTQIQGSFLHSVQHGIGLNIESAPPVETSPFVPRTACLADAVKGRLIRWPTIAIALLRTTFRRLRQVKQGGVHPILKDYRRYSCCMGRQVVVWAEGTTNLAGQSPLATGKCLSIDPDLSLRIEGIPSPIPTGRLTFPADSGPVDPIG